MLCTVTGTVVSHNQRILVISATPRPRYDHVPVDNAIVYTETVSTATKNDGTWELTLVQGETYAFRIGSMDFVGRIPFVSTMDFSNIVSPLPLRTGVGAVLKMFVPEAGGGKFVEYPGPIVTDTITCCTDSIKLAIRSEYTDGKVYLPVDLLLHFTVVADNTNVIMDKCSFEVQRPSDNSDTTLTVSELLHVTENMEYWFGLESLSVLCPHVTTYPEITIQWS